MSLSRSFSGELGMLGCVSVSKGVSKFRGELYVNKFQTRYGPWYVYPYSFWVKRWKSRNQIYLKTGLLFL